MWYQLAVAQPNCSTYIQAKDKVLVVVLQVTKAMENGAGVRVTYTTKYSSEQTQSAKVDTTDLVCSTSAILGHSMSLLLNYKCYKY